MLGPLCILYTSGAVLESGGQAMVNEEMDSTAGDFVKEVGPGGQFPNFCLRRRD